MQNSVYAYCSLLFIGSSVYILLVLNHLIGEVRNESVDGYRKNQVHNNGK